MIMSEQRESARLKRSEGIFAETRENAGHTLMELVVTLAVIGLLLTTGIAFGLDVYDRIESRKYNEECENLLAEILSVRNAGMMANSLPSGCKLYRSSVLLYYYQANGKRVNRSFTFESFTIKEVSGVLEIRFDVTGTISRSTTLTLVGKNGKLRQLVFQVATGRIYLTDAD